MKRFRCQRYHRRICLLAGGALPDNEKGGVENHLAACADCQRYYAEVTKVAGPLTNWEKGFTHIEATETVRTRWGKAIRAVGEPGPLRQRASPVAFLEWVHEVVWPGRHIWAGLAAVWLVILGVNSSLRDTSGSHNRKASRPSPEMVKAFLEREGLLAELTQPRKARVVEPVKPPLPQPRSDRRIGTLTT